MAALDLIKKFISPSSAAGKLNGDDSMSYSDYVENGGTLSRAEWIKAGKPKS
jgi:hypothetical protein